MSGAVAAHASYNGSGTQGLAVTNKISDASSGDVVSVFWNDNDTTRQLLYGSSTLEVPTSGSGKNASWGGNQIFTVNNDVDCVGDMYLSVVVELNKPVQTNVVSTMIKDTAQGGFGRLSKYSDKLPITHFVGALAPTDLAATTTTWNGTGYTGTTGLIKAPVVLAAKIKASFESTANSLYFTLVDGVWTVFDSFNAAFNYHDLDKDEIIKLVNFYNAGDTTARGGGGVDLATDPYNVAVVLPTHSSVVRPVGGPKLPYSTAFDLIRAKQIATLYQANGTTLDGHAEAPQDYLHLPATGGPAGVRPTAAEGLLAIPWTSLFDEVPEGARGIGIPTDLQSKGKWANSNLTTKVKFPLANVLKRIEFQVGTQIWQTLEYNDLLSINATEIAESSYDRLGLQTSGYVRSDGQREAKGEPIWAPGVKYQAFIPLPMLTKSIGPQLENFNQQSEDGYLMAAAPHQNVKIKVHYSAFNDIFNTTGVYAKEVFSNTDGDYVTQPPVPWEPTATLTTKLYAQHMIMCNEEREQMKNMDNGIPKRLKMTQNVNLPVPPKFYPDQAITVDLDHYSIYGSHLIITASFPGTSTDKMPTLKFAELKLNSASFSGQLDGSLLRGITNKTLGLYANQFNLDKEMLDSGIGYYVFPLASKAFGGSSIPLNRFDNIRLLLTFDHPDITSSGQAYQGTINVTGVGETTGLYKAGAASLAMY